MEFRSSLVSNLVCNYNIEPVKMRSNKQKIFDNVAPVLAPLRCK